MLENNGYSEVHVRFLKRLIGFYITCFHNCVIVKFDLLSLANCNSGKQDNAGLCFLSYLFPSRFSKLYFRCIPSSVHPFELLKFGSTHILTLVYLTIQES